MRDLPEAPELLALARDVLVSELLPLLPPERQLDARLVANCMAIAEREATPDRTEWAEIVRELEALYHSAALTHPALPAGSPPPALRERVPSATRRVKGRRVRVQRSCWVNSPSACASAISRIRRSAQRKPALSCGG